MIEGIKLVFFRTIYAVIVEICVLPVWNVISRWVSTQNITFCGDAIPYVTLGVQQIPWILMAGIALACAQTYYRGVYMRQFESSYSQGEVYSVYNR